jgi:uroporphyrinogen-III synthase
VNIPDTLKYFCISESTAFYLQKYIVYRKRKIFHANGTMPDLIDIMKKHKDECFLVPLSDLHSQETTRLLDKGGFNYKPAILYRTVSSNLQDLKDIKYDILVFFSPSGIKSLLENFPDFRQNDTKIACFGSTTAQASLIGSNIFYFCFTYCRMFLRLILTILPPDNDPNGSNKSK